MAFWDDWQKNKNPIAWSEGFQHGYKKIPKSSTPSSEELSLAKANKKLVGKEKLDKNMQNTVQKVVKNMVKEGITSGRFDKNKPRDLVEFNQKFIDKSLNKTSLNGVSSTADSNSYTITSRIKKPFPGREYAHKTIHDDGTVTISYGPTPDPKDATDFIGKRSTTKPTIDSTVKEAAKPTDGSEAFIKGVARSAKKISNGKDIDPTAEGSLRRMVSKDLPNEAPRVDGKGISKPDERAKASTESFNKKMSEKHFKETSTEPISNSAVKNSKVGNWLKNSKVGGYFTDSPLTPHNVALTYKGWTGQANPVAYQLMQGMGVGGGYMPLPGGPEENRNRLRTEFGQDELSDIDTVVKMNPQGTIYLDPKLGIQPTEVVEDYEGNRFYRNAQTGQFEPLDYNPRYSTYVPLPRVKKVYPTDSNGVPYLNDILGGVLSMPKSDTPLPIPPMQEPYNSSTVPENQTPLPESYSKMDSTSNGGTSKQLAPILEDVGRVSPGSATASTNARVKPTVNPVVKSPRKAIKPRVVNNTPDTPVVNTPEVPVSNVSAPIAAPTLSSVASQAVRHNGGFDNYRRQSVLSALRAAGGISPAEAVQRGIIPWEALNYV